jgi:hypothetical protein
MLTASWKKAVSLAALAFAAATLAGCVVEPAPYYGGEAYYAQPAPVYVTPRVYYGSRWGYWHRNNWRGGGWHGGGGHHWH